MTITAVFCDGGVVGMNPSPVGGTFGWAHVDEHGDLVDSGSDFIPSAALGGTVTNNESEMAALIAALRGLPDGWSGKVCSDSQLTLGRAFLGWRYRPHGSSKGIPEPWMAHLRLILARLGEIEVVRLDGHPTKAQLASGIGKRGGPVSPWNCYVDALCTEAAARHKESA